MIQEGEKIQYKRNFQEKYQLGKQLMKIDGHVFYEGISKKNQQLFTIKLLQKHMSYKAKISLQKEIQISKLLNHQNFIKLYDVYEDDLTIYLIYEHISNQYVSLGQILKEKGRLPEKQVIPIVSQLIAALRYLRSQNIIHRDIKLSKILIGDCLKIVEFTCSVKLDYDGQRRKSICGTPSFTAPEILHGKQGYSFEIDIWGLGVITYWLLIGKKPFEFIQRTPYSGYNPYTYQFPEDVEISVEAKDFIVQILQKDPDERSSLDDLGGHPFVRK